MTMTIQAPPRNYWLLLAAITVTGLAIRLLHFSVAFGSDDQVWVNVAREISIGAVRSDEPVYYTRLLWTWLLIFWGRLGSLTLEWTAVLMFLLGGLTTVFIAQAARTAFDVRAALFAAIAYAAHPLAVTFDAVTLPDGFAVCLLSAASWHFVRYLRAHQRLPLVVSSLLIGLLFGVKNYFMLVSIPCALTILRLPLSWRERIAHIGMLAGAAGAGLVLVLLLGVVSGVDASSHVVSAGNYVNYISQGLPVGDQAQGARQLIATLIERGGALAVTFYGFGALMGALTLFGFTLSVCRSRQSPAQLFLASTVLLFLLFLMFMPMRLSPLTFAQLHERYLTVVLPALAISTGAAIASVWDSLAERDQRGAAACLLVAIVAYSAWVPNGLHDRYGTLEIRAVRQALTEAPEHRTTTLLLPSHFNRLVPDSYRERGVLLRFVDFASPEDAATVLDSLAANPSAAMITFRMPYRNLREKLLTGDYNDDIGYGPYAELMREAHARNMLIEEVRVPYDSLRVWLARLGIATRGQLVAWVIRKPAR